jgi:hypothetical protein
MARAIAGLLLWRHTDNKAPAATSTKQRLPAIFIGSIGALAGIFIASWLYSYIPNGHIVGDKPFYIPGLALPECEYDTLSGASPSSDETVGAHKVPCFVFDNKEYF